MDKQDQDRVMGEHLVMSMEVFLLHHLSPLPLPQVLGDLIMLRQLQILEPQGLVMALLVSWVGELVLVEKQCQELHSKLLRLNMEQLPQHLQTPGPTNCEIDKAVDGNIICKRQNMINARNSDQEKVL